MMRVKQVIKSMIDGAIVNKVMTARTLMAPSTSVPGIHSVQPDVKIDPIGAGLRAQAGGSEENDQEKQDARKHCEPRTKRRRPSDAGGFAVHDFR